MTRIAARLRAIGLFWWDFVVGEDWRVAAGIVVGLAVTGALAANDVPAWWVMPVAVVLTLGLSLRGAVRRRN
jgi:hypothetical protein